MADAIDQVDELDPAPDMETGAEASPSAQGDIFDQLAAKKASGKGDIFDQLATAGNTQGDIFDQLAAAEVRPAPVKAAVASVQRGFTAPLLKGIASFLEQAPVANAGAPAVIPALTDINRQRAERTSSQVVRDIQENPLFQQGKLVEEEAPQLTPGEARSKITKLGGYVGSAAPIALGPLAPPAFAAAAYGEHVDADYQENLRKYMDAGMSRESAQDVAAEDALNNAFTSAGVNLATFYSAPKVFRAVAEPLVEKFGSDAFRRWALGRMAAAGEGATLGGSLAAGENVVSGRPAGEGVAQGAGGMAVMNLLLPWLREKPQRPTVPPETIKPEGETIPPAGATPAPEPATKVPVTEQLLADLQASLRGNQLKPKEEANANVTPEPENAPPAPSEPGQERTAPATDLQPKQAADRNEAALPGEPAAGEDRAVPGETSDLSETDQAEMQRQLAAELGQTEEIANRKSKIADEPVAETEAEPASPEPAKRTRRGVRQSVMFDRETELVGPDILDWIVQFGGMISKSRAQRLLGAEKFARNSGEFDDAPKLPPRHNLIYPANAVSMPDQIAQAAYDAGALAEPSVPLLWERIQKASNARKHAFEQQRREEKVLQEEVAQHQRFAKAKESGPTRVDAEELQPGDTMQLAGETLTVKSRDPETGDVELEDGSKFGLQRLPAGDSIYVEKIGEELTDRLAEPATAYRTRLNSRGDAIGTRYHATAEDWAEWQRLMSMPATEEGVWEGRENLKNKYGSMPPLAPETPPPSSQARVENARPGSTGEDISARQTREKTPKPDFALERPESVEEQKARLAQEAKRRKFDELRQWLQDRAARKLEGTRGDIGQRDLLGGGDLFSEEPGDPSLWHVDDAELVAEARALEQSGRLSHHDQARLENLRFEAAQRGLPGFEQPEPETRKPLDTAARRADLARGEREPEPAIIGPEVSGREQRGTAAGRGLADQREQPGQDAGVAQRGEGPSAGAEPAGEVRRAGAPAAEREPAERVAQPEQHFRLPQRPTETAPELPRLAADREAAARDLESRIDQTEHEINLVQPKRAYLQKDPTMYPKERAQAAYLLQYQEILLQARDALRANDRGALQRVYDGVKGENDYLARFFANKSYAFGERDIDIRRVEGMNDALHTAEVAMAGTLRPKPGQLELFEKWLDRAIEATDPLKGGYMREGVTGAPVWLTQTLAHGLLKVVRAALQRGLKLADAITQGVEWLRYHSPENFDAAQARAWLEKNSQQQFPEEHAAQSIETVQSLAQRLTDLRGVASELRSKGQKTTPELRQSIRETQDAYYRARRDLLAQPAYVEALVRRMEATRNLPKSAERSAALEDLGMELEQVPPEALNTVYHDLQQRGVLPASAVLSDRASLKRLSDWLIGKDLDSPKPGVLERLALVRRLNETAANLAETGRKAWLTTSAGWDWLVRKYWGKEAAGDFREVLQNWHLDETKTNWETLEFQRLLRKQVPDPVRRQAILIWVQAAGDEGALQLQAETVPDNYRRAWKTAIELTPDEKALGRQVIADWAQKLDQGMNAGIIEAAHDGYAPQIWRTPPKRPEGSSEAAETRAPGNWAAKLDTRDPFFYFHKAFHNYYEGIMAGGVPRSLDVSDLVGIYNVAFNKSLTSRAVVKAMLDAKASDNMPLVMVSGRAQPMPDAAIPGKGVYLVDSKYRGKAAVTAEGDPYRSLDHPALRDWKWVEHTQDGRNILTKGDMLVHPEAFEHLKNVLQDSALRQGNLGKVFKPILAANYFLKNSKLALGTFHLATEAEHAIFHTTNPWNGKFRIDLTDPKQAGLVRGGLDLGMHDSREFFSEGMSSHGGLFRHVPGLGDLAQGFTDFLFKDYIPAIKMRMALHALERNQTRYGGKLSLDELHRLTADQSNAAFGAQNYRLMGRSPILMDLMRLTMLAPDFLEARMRFVGQAFTRYGGEQRRALVLMAGTLYVGARILNALLSDDNDPHWEAENAFSVIYRGKKYALRTVAQDVWHMFTDPRSFWYNRISPLARTAVELATSRDWRGIRRSGIEQLGDLASWLAPVGFEGFLPGARGRELTPVQMIGQSVGVMSRKFTAASEIRPWAQSFNRQSADPGARLWQKQRDQEVTPESDYSRLTTALEMNDLDRARREYDRLIAGGHKAEVVQRYYAHARPFTGTVARERDFVAQLSPRQAEVYRRAQAEHSAIYQRLQQAVPEAAIAQ